MAIGLECFSDAWLTVSSDADKVEIEEATYQEWPVEGGIRVSKGICTSTWIRHTSYELSVNHQDEGELDSLLEDLEQLLPKQKQP